MKLAESISEDATCKQVSQEYLRSSPVGRGCTPMVGQKCGLMALLQMPNQCMSLSIKGLRRYMWREKDEELLRRNLWNQVSC